MCFQFHNIYFNWHFFTISTANIKRLGANSHGYGPSAANARAFYEPSAFSVPSMSAMLPGLSAKLKTASTGDKC